MSFYSELGEISEQLIAEGLFVPLQLVRSTGSTGNAKSLGLVSTGSTTIDAFGNLDTVKTENDRGELVITTVATVTVEPKIGDRLTINGKSFTVKSVSVEAPDGNALVYEAVVI